MRDAEVVRDILPAPLGSKLRGECTLVGSIPVEAEEAWTMGPASSCCIGQEAPNTEHMISDSSDSPSTDSLTPGKLAVEAEGGQPARSTVETIDQPPGPPVRDMRPGSSVASRGVACMRTESMLVSKHDAALPCASNHIALD